MIVGIDEAGRGPLAGPVIAAAVILNKTYPIPGLKDSKQLAATRRTVLEKLIKQHAVDYAVGKAEVDEIDALGILQATLLAMKRAVDALKVKPSSILIDGIHQPHFDQADCTVHTIIKGDQKIPVISAASVVAKVTRDSIMQSWDKQYPEYNFKQHKGYGTAEHLRVLRKYGYSPIHRRRFSPINTLFPRSTTNIKEI